MKWLAILVAGLLSISCTITPKPATAAQASDWAKRNIVSYDSKGVFVREDWVRVYHGLLKAYGNKLPINEQVPGGDDVTGVALRGSLYHIDFVANKRFTDLKRIEAEAGP
jgi:hypothetical protein